MAKLIAVFASAYLVALVVSTEAQPVLAYQYRENVPATEVQCEDEGPYHNVRVFVRFRGKGTKAIWLRCGKDGKKGWGYYHIEEKHGWGTIPKVATAKTIMKGKKTDQDKKGSVRYDHSFKLVGVHYEWRVVVQLTRLYPGEPKPKHIITSHRRGTTGQG